MKHKFSAWMEGAPAIVIACSLPAISHAVLRSHACNDAVVWSLLGVAAGVIAFFRDPRRKIQAGPGELLSPADGTVVAIEDLAETPHYEGPCRRVSIFLSVFNVHVNRSPYDGAVTRLRYLPGKKKNAMNPETSRINESNAVWMDTPGGPITVRQISGAVARRIVCRVQTGESLARGEKFGMIKLGSRTELYLPPGTEVCVQLKQKVRAGLTVMARFTEHEQSHS